MYIERRSLCSNTKKYVCNVINFDDDMTINLHTIKIHYNYKLDLFRVFFIDYKNLKFPNITYPNMYCWKLKLKNLKIFEI